MSPLARALRWSLIVCFGCASSAGAFSRETHFDLTLYFGLQSGCLSFSEALLVASSDQGQDDNASIVAEKDLRVLVGDVPNQRDWHALDDPERVAARDVALQKRMLQEPDRLRQLMFLGQWLHFTQDVVAHRGFAAGFGHAFPTIFGRDPDSLAYPDRGPEAMKRALEMADRTARAYGLLCAARGQAAVSVSSAAVTLLESLVAMSDPAWLAGSLGDSADARRIQAALQRQIAASWPLEPLPAWLRASSNRACATLALHRWIMPSVNPQGEPLNLESVREVFSLVELGSVPPPIPCTAP